MARLLVNLLATLVLLVVAVISNSTVSTAAGESSYCDNVSRNFIHCINYLVDTASEPESECCSGIVNLKQQAKVNEAAPGRICQCIEDMARVMQLHIPFNVSRIESLPIKCQTHLSFPISIAMDCSKV